VSFGLGAEAALEQIIALAKKDIETIAAKKTNSVDVQDRHALTEWGSLLLQFSKSNVGKMGDEAAAKGLEQLTALVRDDENVAQALGLPSGTTLGEFLDLKHNGSNGNGKAKR